MEPDWENVAAARREVADTLDSLTASQLERETLCAGWTAREIAGHLVSFVELSLPSMMFSMLKSGFRVDTAWDRNARRFGSMPMEQITATLRSKAAQPSPMKSYPAALTLTDVMVHTQDLRRPLGLGPIADPVRTQMALDFVTSHAKGKIFVDPKRLSGLRLRATDLDWSWGTGDEVEGTAEALLMAIFGRAVGDELSGPAAARL